VETEEILAASDGSVIEMALPLAFLGQADSGDQLTMRTYFIQNGVDREVLPATGPSSFQVPDISVAEVILEIEDPANDDHGPGTYTYPSDGVFSEGNFDILSFLVGTDEEEVVFKLTMRGPVDNSWGSSNGLSVQTVDIYIDKDGDGVGGDKLLAGRNLAFTQGQAWDYAIWAEGWEPGIYQPGENGPQEIASGSEFTILTDPGQRVITIRVPKSIIGDDPENWRFAVTVCGQEGYPKTGVWRVREVDTQAAQWHFGGAPDGTTNHTRVMDIVWPASASPTQEEMLSNFIPSNDSQGKLTADDFAKIWFITP
jgi:carbohydrate-binding DOMON domain-containing protein